MMRRFGLVFVLFWINSCLGQNYTVTTVLEDEYMIDNGDGTFSGFMVDLLDELAKRVGFSYDISLNSEGRYGMKDNNGNWDGMIGELRGVEDVHIAAAPFVITDERKSAVPFTRPFRHIGHRILLKKPVVEFHSLKVLFEPFSLPLWIMVIVICIIVSTLLFIINKFSPSEWSKVQPEDDPTNSRDSFSPNNAFFFVHSTLTWQGFKEAPRSPAGRILATMWFSFIFFMVIAYIANLTAFFLARNPDKPVIPFKTWEEMASQSTVSYGVKASGMMYRMMKNSQDQVLQRVVQNIDTFSTSFSSHEEGVKKVRESDGKFAAIVPVDISSKAVNEEPCDLISLGAVLAETPYGMACRSEQICNSLSGAFQEMLTDGRMFSLIHKWFWSKIKCSVPTLDNYVSKRETAQLTARSLSIADTSLAFVVLLIGVVLCLIFLVIEVLVHRRRKTKSASISMIKKEGNVNNLATDVEQARLTDEQEKAPIATNEASNTLD